MINLITSYNKIKTIKFAFLFFLIQALSSCVNGKGNEEQVMSMQQDTTSLLIQNPVLPGDFADPSVVRVGQNYWATATSSEWAPLFPLLHSKNLIDWEIAGHVFPDNIPEWAEAHFWAPEIAYDNEKYYIYYTAKKKGGPLCVGVASSSNAAGPYEDHGPIICQEAGAIDGFQIRDDEGELFLIWKEDGNSRGEPTPMWAQKMNEERTELLEEKFELFRNDPNTWEGNLVEGAYVIKKNGYFYMFYSGDACCGRACTYGIGIARAKELQGPWEKYDKNPIKKENEEWDCAGHGSLVKAENGKYFFLYHAYSKDGSVYTGRQGLLSEVFWGEDGWPNFNESGTQTVSSENISFPDALYDFDNPEISHTWQWPVGEKPKFEVKEGKLIVESSLLNLGTVLAQRTVSPNYEATTEVSIPKAKGNFGLAAIGDINNALGISVNKDKVYIWRTQNGNEEIIAENNVPQSSDIQLKIVVDNGHLYNFYWSEDANNWNEFDAQIDGAYLPPWDRAVRIGITSKGPLDNTGSFNFFKVQNKI